MSQICKDLNELIIGNCYQDPPELISLIEAQKNLRSLEIYSCESNKGNCKELCKALAKMGNTLHYLYLGSGSTGTIPPSFLTSLIALKKLTIENTENYTGEEIKEFQHYLAISEFPNLEYLDVEGLSCFKELAMLIEKTGGNILDVRVLTFDNNSKKTGMLIKTIANNCPKITRLSTHIGPKDFIHVKLLLLNCRQLKDILFSSLDYFVDSNDNIGDELLDYLTKFSPNSLNEIRISGGWKYSIDAFEQFFESCRGRNLHHFGITYHDNNYITEGHKVIIRKYINEGVIKASNVRLN